MSAKQSYYVTTPIYYVNDRPHIGNAYTTIAADSVARYQRLQRRDVFFLTGTDEHGINNARSAQQRGVTPQAHVDTLAAAFQDAWRRLDIAYDRTRLVMGSTDITPDQGGSGGSDAIETDGAHSFGDWRR